MREDRTFLKCGVVGAEDKKVIGQVPAREQIDATQKAIQDKKMQYKSALPW